jgi:hypothetical protein
MRTSKFRYVAIDPARADGKHIRAIGKAAGLFDFLIDHQTDSEGWVQYGKLISYSWIEARLPNFPGRRTLERWMARLRDGGYVEVFASRPEHGMYVRIVNQFKFPKVQLPLFPQPKPLSITSGKAGANPVEIDRHGSTNLPTKVAAASRQKWRDSSLYYEEVDEQRSGGSAAETPNTGGEAVDIEQDFKALIQRLAAAKSLSSKPQLVEMSDEQKQTRLDLLHEQGRACLEKLKASG